MRLVGSWHQMLATTGGGGVQLHQYAWVEVAAGEPRLAIETDYPWSGTVRVAVLEAPDRPVALSLRVPGWCDAATLRDDARRTAAAPRTAARSWRRGRGDPATLRLELAMPPRVTRPDSRIDAVRGCVALERRAARLRDRDG